MHPALKVLKSASLSYHIKALENWEKELEYRLDNLAKERSHAIAELASIRASITERRRELGELLHDTSNQEINRT